MEWFGNILRDKSAINATMSCEFIFKCLQLSDASTSKAFLEFVVLQSTFSNISIKLSCMEIRSAILTKIRFEIITFRHTRNDNNLE